MNKNTKISLVLTGAMVFSSLGWTLAYADGPSWIVTYNGQSIEVTNGQFSLNGIVGTIDAQGNYAYNGTVANILNTPGVSGYQVTGQAAVPVTVVPPTSRGPNGIVTYNGQAIQVTNGQFILNGKIWSIDENSIDTWY